MNAYKSRIVVAVATTAAGLCVAFVPTASGTQAGFIAAHQHYILGADGVTKIWVGPDACGDPKMQTAFNQFHARIHVGAANVGFDHTHNPVDIKSQGCP